jgi:N-acetyl-anhydromuramyl-L-alanine amidase AmpD
MTATFADYVAEQDARNTIEQNVNKWTLMLCEALKKNYIDYSIRSHQNTINKDGIVDESYVPYHQQRIEELKNGECDYEFTIESGRKYHKVIMNVKNSNRSVHCFIDKKSGEVYKSASWQSPAKGVRYDLRIITQREWLLKNADWAGGYLYKR